MKNALDIDFILSQGSSFIKAESFKTSTLNCLLSLHSKDILSAESDQTQKKNHIKHNRKHRWHTITNKIQKPDEDHRIIDVETFDVV